MKRAIKYIIFDMDGVLLDSMPNHIKAWTNAFQEHGFPVIEQDIKNLSGVQAFETVQVICDWKNMKYDPVIAEKIISKKYKIKNQLPEDRPYKEAMEMVSILKEKKLPLGVVSGSPKDNVSKNLSVWFPFIFEFHIGAEDTQNGKPHPDPFNLALEIINKETNPSAETIINPWECLVVEDGIPGLKGAREAGMQTIAIATTLSTQDLSPYSDTTVKNHSQLMDWFQNQFPDP